MFHDPAEELCNSRQRAFTSARELEQLIDCVRKHETTTLLLDSAEGFETELLLADMARVVAPDMPPVALGRTAVVTHLYGNGFTAHWTLQVDAAGVRELWVKDFYEAN